MGREPITRELALSATLGAHATRVRARKDDPLAYPNLERVIKSVPYPAVLYLIA